MLDHIFGRKVTLTCPYCLGVVSIPDRRRKGEGVLDELPCPASSARLPLKYELDYEQVPPLFVPMIGWTSVGKTVYLYALTMILAKMGRLWRGFVPVPATD